MKKKIPHTYQNQILLFPVLLFLIFLSCSKGPIYSTRNNLFQNIETDKSRYGVGKPVQFFLQLDTLVTNLPLKARYYYEGKIIQTERFKITHNDKLTWSWQPPSVDYCGYLVEITPLSTPNNPDRITIAVDVSSDWKRYPRYGFLSKYPEMTADEIDSVIHKLNRYHINGLQFYDWHNTHHRPLPVSLDNSVKTWPDIANRQIYRSTIRQYIETAHKFGMNTMAYNLLYGAWYSGFSEGVSKKWGLYKDKKHQQPFFLNLPDGWADDIYFMNPANPDWKKYLFSNMSAVFQTFDFDGWHIDQIGDLDTLYTYYCDPVILKETFGPFITEAKQELNTRLVMNAVSQYGGREIATSAVDFIYNEVWNPDSTFNHLVKILDDYHSETGLYNTVLPAYMNYAKSGEHGYFNTPGILLTDAVIFANGGAHLELGEHMLCHEYFPNDNLKMSQKLKGALVNYYDFGVAYQTLLRNPNLESHALPVSIDRFKTSHTAEKGTIWTICKTLSNKDIIHLINLTQVDNINWRDTNGTRKEPDDITDLTISIQTTKEIKSAFSISPDQNGGVPNPVRYIQKDHTINLYISSLKYWTAIILEY